MRFLALLVLLSACAADVAPQEATTTETASPAPRMPSQPPPSDQGSGCAVQVFKTLDGRLVTLTVCPAPLRPGEDRMDPLAERGNPAPYFTR